LVESFENLQGHWNSRQVKIVCLMAWAKAGVETGVSKEIFKNYLAYSSKLVIFAPRYSGRPAQATTF
jgi:hypothetical protein